MKVKNCLSVSVSAVTSAYSFTQLCNSACKVGREVVMLKKNVSHDSRPI